MSIQSVRLASQKALLKAADEAKLSDEQLAEAIKAGWIAYDAKYCPGGKKSATCPFPTTKSSAFKAIDEASKVEEGKPGIQRQKIVGVSNVDDGKFPLTAESKEKIDLFNAAVAKKIGVFKAVNACKAKGTVFDLEKKACAPVTQQGGMPLDTNMLLLGAGALALFLFFGRTK